MRSATDIMISLVTNMITIRVRRLGCVTRDLVETAIADALYLDGPDDADMEAVTREVFRRNNIA